MAYAMTHGNESRTYCLGDQAMLRCRPEITGDLWKQYSSVIGPASHGEIYRND